MMMLLLVQSIHKHQSGSSRIANLVSLNTSLIKTNKIKKEKSKENKKITINGVDDSSLDTLILFAGSGFFATTLSASRRGLDGFSRAASLAAKRTQ